MTSRRFRHAESGQADETHTDGGARVVVRAVHQRAEPEQVVGDGVHRARPFVVRRGAVRELLPRVLRRHRAQVRRAAGAAVAVRGQRARVAVAGQPVRPGLHAGPDQRVRTEHDVRAAHRERPVRVRVRRARPRVLLAQAQGHRQNVLRVPRPRAQARPGRHTAQHIAHAGQQPPGDRVARARRAHLRQRGRHALRAARTAARGEYTTTPLPPRDDLRFFFAYFLFFFFPSRPTRRT